MHKQYGKVGSVYVRLAEECAELIQCMMKIERFGPLNFHPAKPTDLNIYEAVHEIDDIEIAIREFKREVYHSFKCSDIVEAKARLDKAKEAYNEIAK